MYMSRATRETDTLPTNNLITYKERSLKPDMKIKQGLKTL
jgi:hypothetical protein